VIVTYLLTLLKMTFIVFLLGAILPSLLGREAQAKDLSMLLAAIGSLLGMVLSLSALIQGSELMVSMLPSFEFRMDSFSAFFILLISGVSFLTSLYSSGYMNDYLGKGGVRRFCALYNLLIVSMIGVVLADDVYSFFISWEMMSIISYFLVIYNHESQEALRAGFIYFIIAHIGTVLVSVAFTILSRASGGSSFADFRSLPLAGTLGVTAFILSFIGFGTKAGMVPLHIWRPGAYSAAPANVGLLMSGVVAKLGIYGMARFLMDFLEIGGPWWGILILIFGAITALVGVIYALMEVDIKRVLAYSSVENIGIILMGLGLATLALYLGDTGLAKASGMASLFHLFNHALFKGLLFMGVGAIVGSSYKQNMEEYGGLIRIMPATGFFFLMGSLAISALPPLNGFASEWMLYQSLFQAIKSTSYGIGLFLGICASILGMAGALALGCFVRAFGALFLAKPRSERSEDVTEAPSSMLVPMAILALLCLGFGIFPSIPAGLAGTGIASLGGFQGEVPALGGMAYPMEMGNSSLWPIMVVIVMALVALGLVLLTGKRELRRYGTWDCGFEYLNEKMEYTPTGFSKPLRYVFSNLLSPRRQIVRDDEYFPETVDYKLTTDEKFQDFIYRPVKDAIMRMAGALKSIDTANVNLYLAYMLLIVIGLLIYIR
jgi:hydrogenase-4 component B